MVESGCASVKTCLHIKYWCDCSADTNRSKFVKESEVAGLQNPPAYAEVIVIGTADGLFDVERTIL
jgi:hypothetical protein